MPTLADVLHSYLLIDRSPATNLNYKRTLTRLIEAIGPARDIALVTGPDLADYTHKLLERGIKRSSAGEYTRAIRTFFAWCVRQGFITRNPAEILRIRKDSVDPLHSRAMPTDALKALVAYTRVTSPRNYAILLFLADTGCRAGGIASLTLDHLDLEERIAWLLEKGGRWHKAYFGEETADALRRWLAVRGECNHNHVFTTSRGRGSEPLKTYTFSELIRRLSLRVVGKAYGPHSIRHAVGHALAKRNLPPSVVQRKLGHSSPDITIGNYYPKDDDYLRQVSDTYALIALEEPDELREENVIPLRVKRASG